MVNGVLGTCPGNEQLDLEQGHGQGPQHQGCQIIKSI